MRDNLVDSYIQQSRSRNFLLADSRKFFEAQLNFILLLFLLFTFNVLGTNCWFLNPLKGSRGV